MTRLLLASASPRRRELLALLGLPFAVMATHVAEVPRENESPAALAARLSKAKARAAQSDPASGSGGAGIIGCDTVVALAERVLGKPRDAHEAAAMLRQLRGRPHAVCSALTVLDPATGRTMTDVAVTQVVMRAYSEVELVAYVASGDPLDKAGAYAVQHAGFHPVAEMDGCYASVMGLPLCHLTRCLRAWGIELTADVPAACQAHTGHRCAVYGDILEGRKRVASGK